jgi:hypothetical protein
VRLWKRVYAERRAVVLPLIVLLVANLAVLALVVFPLEQNVNGAHDTAFDSMTALEAAKKENQHAKIAKARKDDADVELAKFYAEILPKNDAEASDLTNFWLHRQAAANGLDFETGQWKREPLRESRLTRIEGTVLLRGTYANITKFLYDLETAEEFVVVEKVELGESGTVEAAGGGIIEISLDVATYFVTPPGEGDR